MSDFLKLKKSNCKNCYKCIRHCPVKSIRFSGNQANIVADECILCGECFVVCPQNAKQIADDTEKIKVMLKENEKVIVSLAPSFIANYNGAGIGAMEEAIKQLGFYAVEETAIGATIVKKEYEKILDVDTPDVLISSCCNTVNLLIQKYYPGILQYLADVVSPMQAHCIDIKKRYPDAKTVFIGPCLSKKEEADRYKEIVDGVLTFEELSNWLAEEKIDIRKETDANNESKARLFPTSGGILKTMDKNEDYTYLVVDGMEDCISAIKDIESNNLKKCFIEMSACSGSCICGPVMEKYKHSPVRDYLTVESYAGKKDFDVAVYQRAEVKKSFEIIDKKQRIPGEEELRRILNQMGKVTPDKELNCGSCGYNTCREKAVAIYQGKADISMCMPYLQDKSESFSDNIINNSPNGIIVLNEELEVQQINKAAMNIMNIRDSSFVMGEQVIRILDPKEFINVKNSGISIREHRTYLAEYQRYVEQTIIYDKNYHILICIMRDITSEETERSKKETISRQTIESADRVVDKQMRVVQEIASLLGETAAETKIVLTKLKEAISDE